MSSTRLLAAATFSAVAEEEVEDDVETSDLSLLWPLIMLSSTSKMDTSSSTARSALRESSGLAVLRVESD